MNWSLLKTADEAHRSVTLTLAVNRRTWPSMKAMLLYPLCLGGFGSSLSLEIALRRLSGESKNAAIVSSDWAFVVSQPAEFLVHGISIKLIRLGGVF